MPVTISPALPLREERDFYIGSLVDLELNNRFHLQPEVLYSREGIKDVSIDYLNIPVTPKWYFIENVHLNAGPQLEYLLTLKGGAQGLNSTNFAVVFGLGYEAAGGFIIDTRYSLGIAMSLMKICALTQGWATPFLALKPGPGPFR